MGNRAVGDRLPATLAGHPHRDGLLRIAAGLVLTAPFTPMLFMGEEWGADTPWQFFTDHTDPFFADAVSNGRRSEFAAHGWGFADVPDPQDKETFLRSKLDWASRPASRTASLLDWYRSLLALRRSRPELADPRLDQVRVDFDEDARWLLVHRGGAPGRRQPGRRPGRCPGCFRRGGQARSSWAATWHRGRILGSDPVSPSHQARSRSLRRPSRSREQKHKTEMMRTRHFPAAGQPVGPY